LSTSKLEKLLFDSTVSHKDVPLLKDLLAIQKKIRGILEDWLAYCRTSLNIMQPDMYLLPELPPMTGRHNKASRLNKNHVDYEKIVLYRRKSKSAENAKNRRPFDETSSEFNFKRLNQLRDNRSKSALMGKLVYYG
jgi:hypothetical protein